MKEFESNLFTIRRNVMNGVNSKVKDWDTIIERLVGANDAEIINNIYEFVWSKSIVRKKLEHENNGEKPIA